MTISEYFAQQLFGKKVFRRENNLLVVILKAYDGNKQVISTMSDTVYQMRSQIMTIENEKYRKTLVFRQRKLKQQLKYLSMFNGDCYQYYIAQLYNLIDNEYIRHIHYMQIFENTKEKVMMVRKEINSLLVEMDNNIKIIDNYRHTYKVMKQITISKSNTDKKQFYESVLKQKEHDYQIMGQLRKALVLISKRLKEMDRRYVNVLMKIDHFYDEE